MMKFPLMRNNILREDLDAVIEHLKQDDPILTPRGTRARVRGRVVGLARREAQRVRQLGGIGQPSDDGDPEDPAPEGGEVIVPPLAGSRYRVRDAKRFTPVFADIDPRTLAMDSKDVITHIGPLTRAVS